MELVSWKTQEGKTLEEARSAKPLFHTKIWEKYRNSKGKKAGKVYTISSTSKFIHAIKLSWFLIKNYKWL